MIIYPIENLIDLSAVIDILIIVIGRFYIVFTFRGRERQSTLQNSRWQ